MIIIKWQVQSIQSNWKDNWNKPELILIVRIWILVHTSKGFLVTALAMTRICITSDY